jgi:hypothetical protein
MSGIDPLKYWLIVAALAGAGGYCFWYGFRAWRKNRIIEDTPTSRVRSASQGYVELLGRGASLPKADVKGPLTGIPCTWWRYKIEEKRYSGRSRSWTTIAGDTSATPFLLDDGTGQCLIDPRGAEVFPGASSVWYGPESWPEIRIPDGEGVFGWLVDALLTDRYRYTEHRLQPKESVFAIGEFRSLGGVSVANTEQEVGELLHSWKQDQAKLLARFDSNRDGVLSADEWDKARAAAREQVLAKRVAEPRQPGVNVLCAPADGRAFLLAASDGESLARRLRWRARVSIAAFLAAVTAVAWMLTRV